MWSDGFNPTVGFVFSLSFSIRMKFWIRNVTSHRIYIGTVSSFHATNLNPKWCSFCWNHFYTVYWRFLRCKLNLNWKFDAWKVQIPENEKLNLEARSWRYNAKWFLSFLGFDSWNMLFFHCQSRWETFFSKAKGKL